MANIDYTVTPNGDGTVTLSADYLQELQDDAFKLQCLEDGGVDNWGWYGESLSEYYEMLEKREA